MGKGLWSEVVKEDGGSLIVQHMIEDWHEAHTSVVAREILEQVEDIAQTACGSLCVSPFEPSHGPSNDLLSSPASSGSASHRPGDAL
jgi:hypothetical protein